VGNSQNKNVRPALDHFYPKEKYPWFAISLYNLVPICETCNSLKNNKFPIGLKNVYQMKKDNSDFVFSVKHNLIDKNMNLMDIETNIEKIYFKEYINENKGIFKLNERYQFHKDIVAEILWKKLSKVDVLLKSFKDLSISENEAKRIVYCNYFDINNFKQRPLSKLTYDIYNDS